MGADRAGRAGPTEQRSPGFRLPARLARSGRIVVEAERLIVEVAGARYRRCRFAVERGQRVARSARTGRARRPSRDAAPAARPPPAGSSWATTWPSATTPSSRSSCPRACGRSTPWSPDEADGPQARTLLGRFLFSGEDVEKPVVGPVGRRAAASRAPAHGRLRREFPRPRRADEPPRHREPRGARRRPAGVPGDAALRLARPRADRGAGHPHAGDRGRTADRS